MSFLAFQVSVNGERIYTVGADDWRHLSTTIRALRHGVLAREFGEDALTDQPLPIDEVFSVQLNASLAVPDGGPAQSKRQLNTHSYKSKELALGDEITIKVVENAVADHPPDARQDPDFPGATAIAPDPDSD